VKRIFYILPIYFSRWFYIAGSAIVALFVVSYFFPALFQIATLLTTCLVIAAIVDVFILLVKKEPVGANRVCTPRFSNGDENKVQLQITNHLPYSVRITILDELPFEFQERSWKKKMVLQQQQQDIVEYILIPKKRGEYQFGKINIFLHGILYLAVRHVKTGEENIVQVYPSYLQMYRYQLLAATNQLQEVGSMRLKKLGQSLEFEQIKEYVIGDDYRTINWKATARKSSLMVNNYNDERSQQVISIIDKGRTMKMAFDDITLLDYAINASLVVSSIALRKQDKAGLLTFAQKAENYVVPDKKKSQLNIMLETLYKQETNFLDSSFENLYTFIRYQIKHRSLLLFFTNFESMYGLQRQLPYLQKIARHHLLIVIFFENTELKSLYEARANSVEALYEKTIAEQFALEKKLMIKELHKNGIMAILTTPQALTANTVNKYLEMKSRQAW
jgi:uncharacterized protein (DUF58 family)